MVIPSGNELRYLDVSADSEWVAKETERKSSSCVVIRLGTLLGTSSTTQGVIYLFLSSGEAELYAAIGAAACGSQLQQFLPGIGCPLPLRAQIDISAGRSMMMRAWIWAECVKLFDITALWCQEAIEKGRFRLMAVDSENKSRPRKNIF